MRLINNDNDSPFFLIFHLVSIPNLPTNSLLVISHLKDYFPFIC